MSAHEADVEDFMARRTSAQEAVFVAERDGAVVGFAELSLRAYAEGCSTSPVAYLEGWFVLPDERGNGIGRALLHVGEEWGRAQGCSELASDTASENDPGAAAHRGCEFEEVSLIRCFRKDLDSRRRG
jgi:aminoglycoside 6'-N-acetyltransferase I